MTDVEVTQSSEGSSEQGQSNQAEMSLDDARELAKGHLDSGDFLEDVGLPFTQRVLVAAAVLHEEAPDEFARLLDEVKASNANSNHWNRHVSSAVREMKAARRRGRDHRSAVIEDCADLTRMVKDAESSLSDLGGIMQRGGELVELVDDRLQPVARGRLRELMARAARWERETKDGPKASLPPMSVVEVIHCRGVWPFDRVDHIVDLACFCDDGEVLFREGLYRDRGIYIRGESGIRGPALAAPTQEDARRAYKKLTGLLVDFELDPEDRAAHEAAWVASLLTILARTAIDAPTPLFLFDANRPRVGKTRLGEMSVIIPTGQRPTPQAAPAGRDSDSEMAKTITGIARSGLPVVFFDNCKGKLGGASLELAITAQNWAGRILGESRQYEGALRVTWIATSNNADLTPDMHGRTLLCRIKSESEAPEERTGFKYPLIMRHVMEHQAEYLTAALVILRAWHVAGRPRVDVTPWGSFEEWGEVIRQAILFAGGVDPCRTRKALDESDSETRAMRSLVASWPEGVSMSAADLSRAMREGYVLDRNGIQTSDLVDILHETLPTTSARSISRHLGYWKGRVVDGRELVREKDWDRNVYVFSVRKMK